MTDEEREAKVETLATQLETVYKQKILFARTVYVRVFKISSDEDLREVDENLILRKSPVLFYVMGCCLVVVLLFMVFRNLAFALQHYDRLIFISILFFLMFSKFYHSYRRSVNQLSINRKEIICDQTIIPWEDIFQIYTVSVPRGSASRNFLCIALNDYSFKEFDVTDGPYKDIGAILENYRLTYINPQV